jgi:hypothetical protein
MTNYLGEHFRDRRLAKELSLGQVARLLGYRNLSKGANKVSGFERTGFLRQDLLLGLMSVLDVGPQTVQDLVARDRQEYLREWERWADEPVPFQIVVRHLPGFVTSVEVPEGVTTPEQAVAHGRDLARRLSKKVFVVLSRRETVGISEEGEISGRHRATPDADPCPSMQLGRARFLLHFNGGGRPEIPRP